MPVRRPAGRRSKLARVLGSSVSAQRLAPGTVDSVHRAVAEQIEALLTWDRAVRADAEDSVHQMRVTIRTIRSLLQASANAFGLTEDARILDELRELAAVLGTARDAEVLADRYQRALEELPRDVVRGPIRGRLVDGAHQRYRAGLRKSLSAMRTERYFRLLDALDGLVAAESAASAVHEEQLAEATIEDGYKRVRKRAKAAAAADAEHHDAALHRFARVPSGCATPPQPPAPRRYPTRPKPSKHCSAITKTVSSAAPTSPNRPTPRTLPGKTPSPTAYCISAKPASHTTASSNSARR